MNFPFSVRCNSRMSSKTVGVLGGMGPYATEAFFRRLLDLTPARKDWDHLRLIIDNNPHIPSRSRHFLYDEPSPLPGMIQSCQQLERYPVDLIVLPCNSASIFVRDLQAVVSVPVLNIIEIASEALASLHPDVKKCVALGGFVTYAKRTYESALRGTGIELIQHGEDVQRSVESLIEELKRGNPSEQHRKALLDIIEKLRRDLGAEAAILACTEFGCLSDVRATIPIIDSSEALARRTIQAAGT